MKRTLFAVVALSVVIDAATPAGAAPFNAKAFFEHMERFSGGSD